MLKREHEACVKLRFYSDMSSLFASLEFVGDMALVLTNLAVPEGLYGGPQGSLCHNSKFTNTTTPSIAGRILHNRIDRIISALFI